MIRTTIDATSKQLQEILDAALRGEEVFVTQKTETGERVVQLFAFQIKPEVAKRKGFGSAKGQIWMSDDFDEPLEEFEEYMR
jgi:antitoxin (DNA-binding transcriptional repressor) of toxin-antitoxin stability system